MATTVTVDTSQLDDLQELPAKIQRVAIARMAGIALDEVERGAARHNKTGALFKSIYNRPIEGGREVGHDPAELTVSWGGGRQMNRAAFVIFGTRPDYIIRPRNKKALRWAGGGRFFFAKKVTHPGYPGDNYLEGAANKAISELRSILDDMRNEDLL